ncbi:MAG: response regulator [Candidatus Hinthialibacter antarcticus]|nr:response regulator [Candidatus Hinthialibacter antarcticus]
MSEHLTQFLHDEHEGAASSYLYDIEGLFRGAKIAVADDEEPIIHIMKEFMTDLGADCRVTVDPRDIIDWLQEGDFDLVLSDINMPHLSGTQLVSVISSLRPYTPVVLMTGKPSLDNTINAVKVGAFDFLLKPFHFEEAKLSLAKALHYRRLRLDNLRYQTGLEDLVEQRTKELSEFLFHSVQSLSKALEARDPYTQGHAQHVSNLVIRIADELGVPEVEHQSLRLAAQLHDIGKIGVPDSILLKSGSLTPQEYAMMKEHVNIGYQILSPIPMLKEVGEYVYEHHERFDGSGYPRGLKGSETHFNSRILMAAEVLDALATVRCYKPAWSQKQIVEFYQKEKGKTFDPIVTDAVLDLVDREGEEFYRNPNQVVQQAQATSA